MPDTYPDLPNKTFLTPQETADFLRISKRKVYYMAQMSILDTVKVGHSLRIHRDSIIKISQEATLF